MLIDEIYLDYKKNIIIGEELEEFEVMNRTNLCK